MRIGNLEIIYNFIRCKDRFLSLPYIHYTFILFNLGQLLQTTNPCLEVLDIHELHLLSVKANY